jgi:hypothetical protein
MTRSDMPAAAPSTGPVDASTVLQVRKAIYGHDRLTPADMELVLEVARRPGSDSCQEWTYLFSEALTDYLVHQNVPQDYIPQDKADWLIATLSKRGVASTAEFAMLIDVMTHALGVPPVLSSFALREIKNAIANGRRTFIGDEDNRPGVVTKADTEALRAVLYAATTGTVSHVSREEAEVLFDIADAASQTNPAFDDLFARAVGNHLMATSMRAPGAAEALRFEKWLDEEETLPGFLSRMLKRDSIDADAAAREAVDRALRDDSEAITDSEAAWVIARLNRDGELSSAEQRLLQFLGAEAPSVAPALQPLIAKANTTAAFGRRR